MSFKMGVQSVALTEGLYNGSASSKRHMARWKKTILIAISCLVAAVVVVVLVAVVRTWLFTPKRILVPIALSETTDDLINTTDIAARSGRFSGALKIKTVSVDDGTGDYSGLVSMRDYIEHSFPLIHHASFIQREVVNNYSLLYTVEGSSPGKLPYLLASHLDVVPADPAAWEVPPFSGQIVNDTYIYGRGAMDDKLGVMAILEALEYMLIKNERPNRTFYLAFGHDEEIGGKGGAAMIKQTLIGKGVTKLDFVLDEGLPITVGVLQETDRQLAIIGVTEKGSANIELSVSGNPGHSSSPPKETTVGILAEAVVRLETKRQPATLDEVTADTMYYMMSHMNIVSKFFWSNLWLFTPIMIRYLEEQPFTNALLRTTVAVTKFNAGDKENVLPSSATAGVNLRVHHSQTVAEAVAFDKDIIHDSRVHIKIKDQREALPVSPYAGKNDFPFQLLAVSIRQVYPDAVVVPGLVVANTDTRWYTDLSNNLYRFLPIVARPADILRYHGNNERVSIQDYHKAVNFFYRVIKNADLMIATVPSDAKKAK